MASISILKQIPSKPSKSWKTYVFNTSKNCVQTCEALGVMTATWHMKENRWSAEDVIVPSEASRIGTLKQMALDADKSLGRSISGVAYYAIKISD